MYDLQLWYWPELNIFIILRLYLNGDCVIESDDLTVKEMIDLMEEIYESCQEPDDFLTIKEMVFIDHLPIRSDL